MRLLRDRELVQEKCLGFRNEGRVGLLVGGAGSQGSPFRVAFRGAESWYSAADLQAVVSWEAHQAEVEARRRQEAHERAAVEGFYEQVARER